MTAESIRRILFAALPVLALVLSAPVPTAEAQSVLKVARGLQSNNVSVFIDRAIVMESNVRFLEVSVANPEIADVSPLSDRSVYIFGRQRGTTTLTLLGENGSLITNVTIKVEADHTDLKRRLQQLLPKEPIEVRTAGPGLVLSGTVSGKKKIDRAVSLARAYAGEAVINMMTVGGTQQVMLRVKIAEMSRVAGKELGISLGVAGSTGRAAPRILTGTAFSPAGAAPTPSSGATAPGGLGGGLDSAVSTVAGFAGAFGAIFTIADNFILNLQIDALEAKGYVRTLAEPNLVALSGREAKFLAGGEVPIPVDEGDGEISIEFKPVGVALNFVPRVLDNNIINIDLSAEVSDIDQGGTAVDTTTGVVPSFIVRRAETTVELRDGQAFAIAGLLREDFADTVAQVPWLGDLPVLGTLFRSADFQRGETELVILVSAHLVTPVDDRDDLAIPLDRIRLPNESELFLLGKTHGGADGGTGLGLGLTGVDFDGDFGYVVE